VTSGDLAGIEALDVSLSSILKTKNSMLGLPKYQRGFVWKPDKVQRLLADLENNRVATGVHNMFTGGILLLEKKCEHGIDWAKWTPDKVSRARLNSCNKILNLAGIPPMADKGKAQEMVQSIRPINQIVDGQQRLTTATILAKVLQESCLDLGSLKTQAKELDSIIHLGSHRRLNLRTEDDADLGKIISDHKHGSPLTSNHKDESVWQKRGRGAANPICKAYTTIVEWLANQLDKITTKIKKRDWLKNYTNFFLHKFGFIMVTVSNDGQAHLVFRAMNSTGEDLTDGELIKSHLFYRDRSIPGLDMETQWASVTTHLDELRTGESDVVSDFFYNYGRSIGLKSKKNGKLAKYSGTPSWAFEKHCSVENMSDTKFTTFCNSLYKEARNFKMIHEPPSYPKWSGVTRKNDLIDLTGLGFKQHIQVLMAARRKLTDSQFDEVIQVIITMVARVFLVHDDVSPSKIEDDWARWAEEFNKQGSGYLPTFKRDVYAFIKEKYPGKTTPTKLNTAFKKRIRETSFNQNQAKHLLRKAEGLVGNPFGQYTKLDLQAEHIFPKSAKINGKWFKNGHTWSNPDKHKSMLGNYIILESSINNCFTKTRTWKVNGKYGLSKPKAKKHWGKYHGFRYYEWDHPSSAGTVFGTQLDAAKTFYTKNKNLRKWKENNIEERTKELANKIVASGHWWFTP